ncbi:monofunctional biosynthetic peptidoglycan transglycosylase [Ursidibacter arcticus]
MAKRRKKKSLWAKWLKPFFSVKKNASIREWAWFLFSRVGFATANFYLCLTLIFSAVPVPFSAYMLQKKAENLLQSDYRIHYDWVSIDDIAWQMQMAVIAGEDQRFDNHFGIDLDAILLALKRNNQTHKKPIGASTISQQTVKNLYLWHGTSWIRKGIEIPLTLLVETLWSKKRVLEVYLNIAEFGKGIFGVEAAAKYYFNKSAKQLTTQESALLAASLPNPFIYRVKSPTQTMRKRQQWIIQQIHNLGGRAYLTNL